MTTEAPKKRRRAPKTADQKAGVAPLPTTAAVPPEANYKCAVCGKKRDMVDSAGKPTFVQASNGGRNCFVCLAAREKAAMAEGRITLTIDFNPASLEWSARSDTGKIHYRLLHAVGMTHASVVAAPTFTDKDGHVWHGRLYKNGQAHFQISKDEKAKPAKATVERKRATRPRKPATPQPV